MPGPLSPEILHHICRQLDSPLDICRFRLTCHSFADIGLRSLLPCVTITTLPKAFERLTDIANHPVLRYHVREILFLTNTLPFFEDIDDFAQNLSSDICWPVDPSEPYATEVDRAAFARHQWPREKLAEAFAFYRDMRAQQSSRSRQYWFAVMRQAISKLPRLRSVHVRPYAAQGSQGGEIPIFWPGSEYSKVSINLLADIPNSFTSSATLLQQILSATLAAKTSLEELSVTDLDAQFFRCDDTNRENIRSSLEQLRSISLRLTVGKEDDPGSWEICRRSLAEGCLQQILQSATQLESIEIICPYVAIERHVASFPQLFDGIVWSSLSRLQLTGFETTSEFLITFLEAHAVPLKVLQLSNFRLTAQHIHDWHRVFARAISFPPLTDAHFAGHFTADLPGTEKDYVDMGDDIKGEPLTVGDALRVLLCRSFAETDVDICKETLDDILKHDKTRLAVGFRMEIPVRHPKFLRSIKSS